MDLGYEVMAEKGGADEAAALQQPFNIDELTVSPWIGLHFRHEFLLHHRHELLEQTETGQQRTSAGTATFRLARLLNPLARSHGDRH